MINIKTLEKLNKGKIVFGVYVAIIAMAIISSIPTYSHASSYAFVNKSDEVSMVVANSPNEAISTAFNIAFHSGVMLLNSSNIGIIGNIINN